MKKLMPIIILFIMLVVPTASYALGLELAVGGWKQSPKGDLSYVSARHRTPIEDTVQLRRLYTAGLARVFGCADHSGPREHRAASQVNRGSLWHPGRLGRLRWLR